MVWLRVVSFRALGEAHWFAMTARPAGSHDIGAFSEAESAGMDLRRLPTRRAVILPKLPFEFIRSGSWNVPRSRLN